MTGPTVARPADRRPLAVRDAGWVQALARRLARTRISPNRISQAGLLAALLSGACFAAGGAAAGPGRVAFLAAAALLILVRVLCNLLDGLVAIEGGKAGPAGRFWNEAPDRASDIAILVGAGVGAGAIGLGWAAASFAVLTAYVREFGVTLGAPADFRGPMAKQHRMAVMAAAAGLACLEPIWSGDGAALRGALWIVAAGAAATALRRAARLLASLR